MSAAPSRAGPSGALTPGPIGCRRGGGALTAEAPRRSLDHVATDVLRDHLTNGRIPPGSRLREIHLARELDFSRSTVRKALQFLAQEGLVVLVPYTGWLVAKLDPADVWELYTLRSALEGLAARLAAERAPDVVPVLRAALEELAAAGRAGDRNRVNDADFELHKTIVRAANHRRLAHHFELVEHQVRLVIASSDALISDLDEIVKQHRVLVEAICAGDAQAAEGLATAHNLVDGEQLLRHVRGQKMESGASTGVNRLPASDGAADPPESTQHA